MTYDRAAAIDFDRQCRLAGTTRADVERKLRILRLAWDLCYLPATRDPSGLGRAFRRYRDDPRERTFIDLLRTLRPDWWTLPTILPVKMHPPRGKEIYPTLSFDEFIARRDVKDAVRYPAPTPTKKARRNRG